MTIDKAKKAEVRRRMALSGRSYAHELRLMHSQPIEAPNPNNEEKQEEEKTQ